jgi:hypothetical protein
MISLVEFFIVASLGTLTAAGASHGYNLLRQPRSRRAKSSFPSDRYEEADLPSFGAWHTPRRGPRHRMTCRIEYVQEDSYSIGMLVDISKEGWRATGRRPVVRGTVISVNVFLPNQPMPIMIDEAVVRWTNGLEFGLELQEMKPEAASRLSDYLAANLPVEQREDVSAISPFSYNK